MNGRIIQRLIENEQRIGGEHNVRFDASNLQDGIYLYRLTTPEVSISKPFVVNR